MKKKNSITLVLIVSCVTVVAGLLLSGAFAGRNFVRGGPPDVQAQVTRILNTFPHAAIAGVEISNPPPSIVENSNVPADGVWLEITAPADAPLADVVYRANLLTSTFNDQASTQGLPPLNGYSVFIEGKPSTGVGQYVKLLPLKVNLPDIDTTATAEASVRLRYAHGSRQIGGTLEDIRFSSAPRLSVDATVAVDDPSDFVAHLGERLNAIVGSDDNYDARELTITDHDGKPFVISSFNRDLQSGSTWIRPDLVKQTTGLYGQPLNVQHP